MLAWFLQWGCMYVPDVWLAFSLVGNGFLVLAFVFIIVGGHAFVQMLL